MALILNAASDKEALVSLNNTEYGLSSVTFTNDLPKGERHALEIDAGMTHINDQTVNDVSHIPFGGNKTSGFSRFENPWASRNLR
ncbi:aldehyde dehydrogenase family protein [Robertmurraya sp. DFI.2.37]|uniref:aldehyde dehydrogenase family protein n=1 Tax=Robertmurraya sp. DFI.2.37 TaxID=3031819 RepID=UPI001CD98B9F|nr:aldehyde dehydrogenase family protein [Robertmurraya sp. DFI.2.37]